MSLSSILTDLQTIRTRFVSVLTAKGITISPFATLNECLSALSAWNNTGSGTQVEEEHPATTRIVLTAPDELNLYAGTSDDALTAHYWTDSDVLSVKILYGPAVLTTSCLGYNGVNFEQNTLSHLCAGYRVLCDVGEKPSGIDSAELTIQWLRGEDVVKTETRNFDWTHIPQYFTRPPGEGNYSLKINGSAVAAQVYCGGNWIDFPNGALCSHYAGYPVRTKTYAGLNAVACWSNEGADGDNFWYLP